MFGGPSIHYTYLLLQDSLCIEHYSHSEQYATVMIQCKFLPIVVNIENDKMGAVDTEQQSGSCIIGPVCGAIPAKRARSIDHV